MYKMVHQFINLEGLYTSIDISRVVFFEEMIICHPHKEEKIIRIVFENKDEVFVTNSYKEVCEVFDRI